MSQGTINILGNLYVNTINGNTDAIVTRGDSTIAINTSGTHIVQMNGDINFNYDKKTSGTRVDADVDITLNGADSYWNGNTLISWDEKPDDSKLTVSEMTLTVKDGATWTPTAIQNTADQKYTSLNNLILDNGNIDVNEGVEIAIDKVSGTGVLDNEGTVTLKSGALGGHTDNAGVINLDPGASISNVTIEQGDKPVNTGLIVADADGNVTLNGGMATGGTATVGSVSVADNKNISIDKAKFQGHSFTNNVKGAINATLSANQQLTISNSEFKNISATGDSSGVDGSALSINGNNGNVEISNTKFSGNSYADTQANNGAYGGAVSISKANVTLKSVTFDNNSSTSESQHQGAGYYQSVGSLTSENITLSNNKIENTDANITGVGMSLWGVDANISGSTFSGNIASTGDDAFGVAGGGLYLRGNYWGGDPNREAHITDVSFFGNKITATKAGAYGGGLYIKADETDKTYTATLTDVSFDGNSVCGAKESQGGGLYILGKDDAALASVTVTDSTFTSNKAEGAAGQGGAIYNAGTLTVNGGQFTGNEAGKYGGAIAGDVDGKGSLNITNATFTSNTSGAGGAIALWSHGTENAATHSISGRFDGNTANRKGGAIAFLMKHSGDKTVTASISGEFLNNSAGESGGAIYSERGTLNITDATFSGNSAAQQGGAIYNDAKSSITFKGNNTFSGNTAAEGKDIYNAGNITVADGTTTLGSGLTQVGGQITVTGGTLDMASGSSLSFDTSSALTINGGTFVADFGQLLTDYTKANEDNGISGKNIVGTSGNLNLRLDGGSYTLQDYNAAKDTLLGQGQATTPENATLNFLNATLDTEGKDLVVGAEQSGNAVTIQMAPVVVEATEKPSEAVTDPGNVIDSVPDQIVSVVDADETDKTPLTADTITISGESKFTAKGLEIAGTAGAEAVTLKVTSNSDITLAGGEAGFTGVVANNDNVATDVVVENASLTVGLEGNTSAQNLALNAVKVADGGTFAVAGNGLDTTQVEASTLTTEGSGTVAVNNATLTVQETAVSTGVLSITNAVSDLGTVDFSGGVLFFDPSYNTHTFRNGAVGGLFLTSDGSVVNVDSGLDNLQELAQKAGLTTTAIGSGKFTVGTGQSMLALGQNLTLTGSGQVIVDDGVTYEGTGSTYEAKIGGQTINDDAYFGTDSLLVVNGNTINGTAAAINLATATNKTLTVQNGAKLLIADAVAGQTYTVISGASNETSAFAGVGYTNASATGWKDANLLTSSDMVTLTSEDGMVFKSASNDAATVFPKLSDGMANAVNTLYGQQLNNTDSPDMGVRFLSRATDNRYLGEDKDAAASTIESAARMAFAGAVPQMTKMASDAATNAVVNRLGFANPADGIQAMDAEGRIVDRNTTGFALWIAPLWQNMHGWSMEAGNLDYGFNGNLGGVSLGADYTFENAIRAGITFNIGGGYAESSGGDLSSTQNNMNFWGLGAYVGWNYQNFGLMADVAYTSTWNDLSQDMDGRMGMGDLEADVQASALSAGVRAEYKLETSVLDVIPHIGVRYMSLNTWGYDVESSGGTLLEADGFHQDIWTFPVGITFSKDLQMGNGWAFTPSVDFSVIPAAGDIEAKHDVAFTGLPGSYEVETQMMDYLTWQGGIGLELGNENMSIGVNYTLQAGQNSTGHGLFGSFRYEF